MESLISMLVVIGILIASIASKANKTAKKAPGPGSRQNGSLGNATGTQIPISNPAKEAAPTAVRRPLAEGQGGREGRSLNFNPNPAPAPEQDRTRPRPEPIPTAPSGSMQFRSTEGVGTSAYQSPHGLQNAQAEDPRFKIIERKLPADKLRAAIAMSEILAKPVTLRGKHPHMGR